MKNAKTAKCCKECDNCIGCYDTDLEKVMEYIYYMDNEISKHTKTQDCMSKWGYGCGNVSSEDYDKIHLFLGYLKDYLYLESRGVNTNMCPEELQKVLEASSKLFSGNKHRITDYSDVDIDGSQFDEWVVLNPYCIAYEDWEKGLAKVCPKVGITVKLIKGNCDLLHKIIVEKISSDMCKLLTTLSVVTIASKEGCLVADVDVTNIASCLLDYKALVYEHKCDLTFDEYVSLLECNMSNEVISNLLGCDITLGFNSETQTPTLVSRDATEYDFTSLGVNIFDRTVDEKSLSTVFGISKDDINKGNLTKLVNSYSDSFKINKEI